MTEAGIIYFLRKHNIPRRTISEARSIKYWGLHGKTNGMYGRTGESSVNWKGGISTARQAFYSSKAWSNSVRKIWKRDNARFQSCDKHARAAKAMHIDHVVSFAIVACRSVFKNLILLCKQCHDWVHSNNNADNEFILEWENEE